MPTVQIDPEGRRATFALHVQCSHPSRARVKIVAVYEPDPNLWIEYRTRRSWMNPANERLVERLVTYTLEVDGQVVVVEHVPARVNEETGERFFSPETVEKLQEIVREGRTPSRTIQAPVFDFAA